MKKDKAKKPAPRKTGVPLSSAIFKSAKEPIQAQLDTQRWKRVYGKRYDPGKDNTHVEKLGLGLYGAYKQTYNSPGPEGDTWVAEIVDVSRGLRVIAQKSANYRFWDKGLLKQISAAVATFKTPAQARLSIEGWRWGGK